MDDKEINLKLKNCKTVEELKAVGKEIGYELTDEEAQDYFDKIQKSGELSDDELDSVSGGGCTKWRNGRAYSGNGLNLLIVTKLNSCPSYSEKTSSYYPPRYNGRCGGCYFIWEGKYCTRRSYDDDPHNPK